MIPAAAPAAASSYGLATAEPEPLPTFDTPDEQSDEFDAIAFTGEKPDPAKLIQAMQEQVGEMGDYHDRLEAAYNTRFCLWDGQSPDGRKRRRYVGREPFPWEGASDARVRLAEEVIRENVARCKAAFYNGQIQAAAHNTDKLQSSQLATELLKWVLKTQMMPDVRDAIDHVANWRETFGLSIMHIGWERQTRMEPQTITLEQVAEMALSAPMNTPEGQQAMAAGDTVALGALAMESLEETMDQLRDPTNETAIADQIRAMAPHLTTKQARAVVADLRDKGKADYPMPRAAAVNRPVWTPLRPMIDVFFPRSVRRLKDAPWIARVEWLTRDQLRAKVSDPREKWDKEFVDHLEEHCRGKIIDEQIAATEGQLSQRFVRAGSETGALRSYVATAEDYRDYYQVLRVYYRATDAKGFAGIYEAVVHPDVPELLGRAELLPCPHGQYPFVDFRRERFHPAMIESRGVPEIIETEQEAVKVQRDHRTDRTELTTLPPVKVRASRGGGNYPIMPGAQIPERANGSTEFMQVPRFDGVTLEIENSIRNDIARYFGRMSENGDPAVAQLIQQDGVDDFLADLGECVRLTWADLQVYLEPVVISRVLGSAAAAAPLQVSRQEIQGNYDFYLTYDVRDSDTEFLAKKIELLNTAVLPTDTQGVMDRARYTARLLAAVDPHSAADVLRPPEQAVQSEIEDEKAKLAQIAAGVEPPLVPAGNHQARLQALEQSISANPVLLERYQRGKTAESDGTGGASADPADAIFAAMVDARVEMHQQQLTQQENAMIGRVGSSPVLGV